MSLQRQLLRCLVCGSTVGHETNLGAVVRRCGSCAFGWTLTEGGRPEPYPADPESGGPYRDYAEAPARRVESDLRLRWLLGTGIPMSLVEAGCGSGFFLEAAAKAGIRAQGVEISEAGVRFARDELGLAVWHGRFEQATIAPRVEAVCAFRVLEHVEDPHEFLLTARQAMRPGGRLALEVSNIASATARRLGPAWLRAQPPHQRWHFTPESLDRLVTRHGFQVLQRDTVFARFYARRPGRFAFSPGQLIPDWIASGGPRVSHPMLGDAIRLLARRPDNGRPI